MPCGQDGLDLAVHHLVGLAEQLAALGVPGDHVGDVELGQHRRRHLAGERALLLPVAVLGAEGDRDRVRLGLEHGLDRAQVGERRVDRHVDGLVVLGRRAGTTASARRWIASKWLWCIFQLPLMSGLRCGPTRSLRRLPLAPQGARGRAGRPARAARATRRRRWRRGRRSSARPNWASGRGAVAAADDVNAAVVGHRLGDRPGAGREARVLEHAHRAVPEHGAGLGDARRRTRRPCPGRCRGPSSRRGRSAPDLADVAAGRRVHRSRRPGPRAVMSDGRCDAVAVLGRAAPGRCRPGRPRAASRRSGGPARRGT